MTEDILYEEERYIGKIILNRPKKLNAITNEMYKEIARLIEKTEEKITSVYLLFLEPVKHFLRDSICPYPHLITPKSLGNYYMKRTRQDGLFGIRLNLQSQRFRDTA